MLDILQRSVIMKICKAYFTFMKAMRKPEPDREREGDFDEKQNRRDQKGAGYESGGDVYKRQANCCTISKRN